MKDPSEPQRFRAVSMLPAVLRGPVSRSRCFREHLSLYAIQAREEAIGLGASVSLPDTPIGVGNIYSAFTTLPFAVALKFLEFAQHHRLNAPNFRDFRPTKKPTCRRLSAFADNRAPECEPVHSCAMHNPSK
jgi:hypothetical protein